MLATLIPHRTTENLPEQDLYQTMAGILLLVCHRHRLEVYKNPSRWPILSHSLPSLHPGHLSPFTFSLQPRPSTRHLDRMTTAWLLLSKSDFVNPDVLNAVNPHPRWGYVHGEYRIEAIWSGIAIY